jgi:hypothetical protein
VAEKVGVFDRLQYDDDASTGTVEFEFLEGSTIGLVESFVSTNGLRGTRSHYADRVRQGTRRVEGNLLFAPTPAELDTLLHLALGGTKSANTIPLAEALPSAEWIVGRDGTVRHYSACYVDSMTVTAQEGGPLQVALAVIGADEAQEGTLADLTIDASTGGPYTLMDGAVTVGGTSYQFSSFELRVENRLEVKYRNSLTPTSIKATDRVVTVSLPFSLADAAALYGSAVGGVTVVATFTNGNCSTSFSMTKVQAPRQPLPFGQRGILDLPWQGVARASGATAELVVANDSTP